MNLSSDLQIEQIVLFDIHIISIVSILSLICKFHFTIEISSTCWSNLKPSGVLMRHCEGIAMAGSFDRMLTTLFKCSPPNYVVWVVQIRHRSLGGHVFGWA